MENEEEKDGKKISIVEIVKNRQYRAIASLSFYVILIIVLIGVVRTSPSREVNNEKITKIEDVSEVDGFDSIKGKNFNFTYTLDINDSSVVYEGKQFGDKVLFTNKSNNKEYFYQNGILLVKDKSNYVLSNNITKYFNYLDIDLIESIISKADKEGNISIKDFRGLIDTKTADKGNNLEGEIYLTLKTKNGIVTSIEFDLSELGENDSDIELTLKYSNFGLIEDFNINK